MFGMIQTPQIIINAVPDYSRYFRALIDATPELNHEAQINGLQALSPAGSPRAESPTKRMHQEQPLPPGVFRKEILQPLYFSLSPNNFIAVLDLVARLAEGYENEQLLWALVTPCINAIEAIVSQSQNPASKVKLYQTITHAAYQFGNFLRNREDGDVGENFQKALSLYNHCCDYSTAALQIFSQYEYSSPKIYVECCLNMAEVIIASIRSDVRREKRYRAIDAKPYLLRALNIVSMLILQAATDEEIKHLSYMKRYSEDLLSNMR